MHVATVAPTRGRLHLFLDIVAGDGALHHISGTYPQLYDPREANAITFRNKLYVCRLLRSHAVAAIENLVWVYILRGLMFN
jgi:hypothetical protein